MKSSRRTETKRLEEVGVTADELAMMWLKDRASDLNKSARAVRLAYDQGSKIGRNCDRVASAYERAASVLNEEAEAIVRDSRRGGNGS